MPPAHGPAAWLGRVVGLHLQLLAHDSSPSRVPPESRRLWDQIWDLVLSRDQLSLHTWSPALQCPVCLTAELLWQGLPL